MTTNDSTKDQTHILILGHSPLPFENMEKNYAPGNRTWHFTYTALHANCKVLLIASRIPGSYKENTQDAILEKKENFEYYSVIPEVFEDKKWLLNKINEFKPDCIVGVTAYPASIVADLNLPMPFWADVYGSLMAEAQAKSFVFNNDSYLQHYFKMASKILSKADIFSVVSEAQGFSLVGELGLWGRLNKNTLGYRFVRVIPATAEIDQYTHSKNVIRGKLTKQSDFVVLYTGGYNTWTDVKTLFYGLEKAMAKNSKIIFVSTGGQIEGHDDNTYENFKNLIDSSPFKDRFFLMGWVPKEELHNYYLEADIGINVDRFCYEALLGSRTRVLDWMRASLTFISTPLSEITNYLIENNLAYGFSPNNPEELAKKLSEISQNKNEIKLKAANLQEILKNEFTFEQTSQEFLQWIKNPKVSPDRGYYSPLFSPKNLHESPIAENTTNLSYAIKLWPKVSLILRKIGLRKYENKIKKFGENIIIDKRKDYANVFLEVSLPKIEFVDKHYSAIVKIKNIGKKTWGTPITESNPVNFSYRWRDTSNNLLNIEGKRTSLRKPLKSGKTDQFNVDVFTPSKPGEYFLEFDMLKEDKFWFIDENSKSYKTKVILKENNLVNRSGKLPLISIIVVCYNGEDYISECVSAILKSDYPSLEIIVIDNASSDSSLKKLEKFKKEITLIKSKNNLGFAGGNNLGIKKSKGEITVSVNQDAIVNPNSIDELTIPFLDEKVMITGPKIFYPNTRKIQSAGGIIQKNALTNHIGYGEQDVGQYDFPSEVDYVTGAVMAIRRKLFEQTGLFSEIYQPAYYEELEKCIQAKKLGYKILFSPKAEVFHYESTTFTKLSKPFLKYFHTNRFRFIYRNFGFSKYIFEFIPSEIKWYFYNCGPSDRGLVAKAHLRALFSYRGSNKKL